MNTNAQKRIQYIKKVINTPIIKDITTDRLQDKADKLVQNGTL